MIVRDVPRNSRLATPPGAHVAFPGVFAIELFPPSDAHALRRTLRRFQRRDAYHPLRGDHRATAPFGTWSTIASLSSGASRMPLRTNRIRIPGEFVGIDLDAVRIGEGFCAVLATFHTADHPKRTRRAVHDAARRWLRDTCPGFFAAHNEPHPLTDVMLPRTSDRAVTDDMRRAVRDHLVRLSISEQLTVYLARYSAIRDRAQSHRGFRIAHIEAQRTNLLDLSLNISTIDRAVTGFNSDTGGRLVSGQTEMLERLRAADEQYRSLLTMAASLTSAMQAVKASRIARWIAALSLVVSLLLLALADTAETPRVVSLLQWLTGHT